MASLETERQMLDRLNVRYGVRYRNGSYIGRRFTRAEQVPAKPGRQSTRIADYIAVDQWSTPRSELTETERANYLYNNISQSLHGFEVKVSRGDLRAELADLSKSEEWAQYCHYWWLVVPTTQLVEGMELPEHWGVLVSHGKSLRVALTARRRDAKPMPTTVLAGLVRAVAKTEVRLEMEDYHLAMGHTKGAAE